MTPSKNLRRSAMIVAVAALLAAWTATATTVGAATPKPGIDAAGLSAGIKPCHDFYAFANQQWLGKTKIPDDRSAWGTFYEIDQRNESILKNLLVEAARDPSLPEASPGRKVADYYASGMNTARIEKAGLAPLRPEFERIQRMKNTGDLVAELARWVSAPACLSASTRTPRTAPAIGRKSGKED